MKGERRIRLILYGIAAALFLCLFLLTFRERTHDLERKQVQVVTFGDSIFGLIRDDTAIPVQLEQLLGKSVFNAAFGGTCVSRMDEEYRLYYAKDALSLSALTKAVAADDFGVQQTARIRESSTEYFSDVVDELERIDFSTVELVVIMHGMNDFYSGQPIYNEENPFDEHTFIGALRTSITALRRTNPDMRIVLVTPTYTWHFQSGQTCEEYNAGFGTLEDYICAEVKLAEELEIELIDLYHDVFPHEKWEDWERYTFDGMHPNEAGRELLAGIIAKQLR